MPAHRIDPSTHQKPTGLSISPELKAQLQAAYPEVHTFSSQVRVALTEAISARQTKETP